MLPMAGRTTGPIKNKLGIGTHVDPRSVLVKVRVNVIYLCVRYDRIHACDTWRITMNHARISSSSSSSAIAAATWWMLMKLLTEARKGRQKSSAKRDNFFRPEDGDWQLVPNKICIGWKVYSQQQTTPQDLFRWRPPHFVSESHGRA